MARRPRATFSPRRQSGLNRHPYPGKCKGAERDVDRAPGRYGSPPSGKEATATATISSTESRRFQPRCVFLPGGDKISQKYYPVFLRRDAGFHRNASSTAGIIDRHIARRWVKARPPAPHHRVPTASCRAAAAPQAPTGRLRRVRKGAARALAIDTARWWLARSCRPIPDAPASRACSSRNHDARAVESSAGGAQTGAPMRSPTLYHSHH